MAKETPFIERVFKAITKKPQPGIAIATKFGYAQSPARVRAALKDLVAAGRIVHTGTYRTSAYSKP